MPKIIGARLSRDGIGWMLFVYPPPGSSFMIVAIIAGLAEISLATKGCSLPE